MERSSREHSFLFTTRRHNLTSRWCGHGPFPVLCWPAGELRTGAMEYERCSQREGHRGAAVLVGVVMAGAPPVVGR